MIAHGGSRLGDQQWGPGAFGDGVGKHFVKAVRQAANTGRISAELLEKDRDLASLFSDPEFQKILEELKKQPAEPR